MADNKIYLLGDSITQGLGSKKVNFAGELLSLFEDGWDVVNLACTGTTVDYALGLLDEGRIEPSRCGRTVCAVLYGNVDAQIRPNRGGRVFPRLPERYKGGGMLMPRPFYSHSLGKSLGQHVDNAIRSLISTLIKVIDGTEQWVDVSSFEEMYGRLLDRLLDLGIEVACCSCVYIDERLFAGSPEQYELFDRSIEAVAFERRLPYVDLYGALRCRVERCGWDSVYNKDHFHPNGEGYRLIAEEIANSISHLGDGYVKKGFGYVR